MTFEEGRERKGIKNERRRKKNQMGFSNAMQRNATVEISREKEKGEFETESEPGVEI